MNKWQLKFYPEWKSIHEEIRREARLRGFMDSTKGRLHTTHAQSFHYRDAIASKTKDLAEFFATGVVYR